MAGRSKTVWDRLSERFRKAVTSDAAVVVVGSAAAGAGLAAAASGELRARAGVKSTPALASVERVLDRAKTGASNVSGSLLVTGSSLGNVDMAALGIGLQAGIAAGEYISTEDMAKLGEPLKAPLVKANLGSNRDLATKLYGLERVDIPDDAPAEEKYKALGQLLTEVAMQGERDPVVVRLAREVTAQATTQEEKARAVAQWVKDHIRYVLDEESVWSKDPLVVPEPGGSLEVFMEPSKTLELGEADCDDTSSLICAMLRAVGVYSKFRMVSQDPANWDIMTHVYPVAVFPPEGRELSLDVTPVMTGGGAEYNPVGWECERVSEIDTMPPKIARSPASKPLSGRPRMGR